MADAKNLVGKAVIDVTNPWDYTGRMSPRLAVGYTDSAGEIVQDSKVIKAFNMVWNMHWYIQIFLVVHLSCFICGNDDEAKKNVVDNFLTKFGLETIDMGGIEGLPLQNEND